MSWPELVKKYNIRECKNNKCLALISDIGGPARKSSADIKRSILNDSNICESCDPIAAWEISDGALVIGADLYQGLIEYLFNNCEVVPVTANNCDNGMQYEIHKTYKLTAAEYIAKHNPTYIGSNILGRYFEHPIYGEESGLLLENNGNMHLTFECEVPTNEDLDVRSMCCYSVVKRN